LCDKSTLEDKGKLSEFYLHNPALTNLNFWDPNENLGDLQLMALTSRMIHEVDRVKEVKGIVEKEEKEPLYIREDKII